MTLARRLGMTVVVAVPLFAWFFRDRLKGSR